VPVLAGPKERPQMVPESSSALAAAPPGSVTFREQLEEYPVMGAPPIVPDTVSPFELKMIVVPTMFAGWYWTWTCPVYVRFTTDEPVIELYPFP